MIAHFDVDAFYASVEIRDNPALREKPVAVAGSSRRAVVLTASYEARPYGVRSALPLYKALQACPSLIVVPPRMHVYKDVSRAIFEVFARRGYPVQGLSLDEAFIDLGPCTLEHAVVLAQSIRKEVADVVGLTVSAGVASGKMMAKILSDSCKPNGLGSLPSGDEAAFLAPLPVARLWGVGPKTQLRLAQHGIQTIGDVASLSDEAVWKILGAWGRELRELARGNDRRPVEPDCETKSISTEETFEFDIRDERRLLEIVRGQAVELAAKMACLELSACTIGVKIKLPDFRIVVRQTNLAEPTREPEQVSASAAYCLQRAQLLGRPVRLLGTRVASFAPGPPKQQTLFR